VKPGNPATLSKGGVREPASQTKVGKQITRLSLRIRLNVSDVPSSTAITAPRAIAVVAKERNSWVSGSQLLGYISMVQPMPFA